MKLTLSEAAAMLAHANKVVITAHENPDGDAVGSSLGLMHLLHGMGKEAVVLLDDDIPAIFKVLPGYDIIGKPEEGQASVEADLLVILDTAPDRIGRVPEVTKAGTVLNIDHHRTNNGAAEYTYVDDTRAATAEIVYDLAKELGAVFTREPAMCIYTGLATDSGFFRFSNTTPHTMRAAAEMLECGVTANEISEALEEKPYQVVKDTAEAVNMAERFADGRAIGIFLDEATTARMEATEGFIGAIRVVEGVDVAVVLKAKEEKLCRVSMRSKGVDVSAIALSFGGGGHIRAAGCTLSMPFAEAKKTICTAIEQAIRDLQQAAAYKAGMSGEGH